MKTMKKIITTLMLTMFAMATFAQQVYTDKDDEVLLDKDYETFAVATTQANKTSDNDQTVAGADDMDYPSKNSKKYIEDAIEQELIGQDYENDKNNPDILVSYTIFDGKGKIRGNFDNSQTSRVNNQQEMDVEAGTLMITITDVESGKTVWQGFEEGAFAMNSAITKTGAMKAVTNILGNLSLESSLNY